MDMPRWVVLCLLLAVGAEAQGSLDAYNGAYLYSELKGDDERIERSIDEAIGEMGLVKRAIARKRLEDATRAFPRVELYFEGEEVLLRYSEKEFELPLDGRTVDATGLNGEAVDTSAYIRGHDLHQAIHGDRGSRYMEFRFHADETMSVVNRIESEHLPGQVKYTLTYRRAN